MLKINCALSTNRTKKQWVDLGIHTEVCMTRPETCGEAGGAISMWVNIIDCGYRGGIVSSADQTSSSRFEISCTTTILYESLTDFIIY